MNLNRVLKKNEFYVFVTIVLLSIVINIRSGLFFSPNNIVNLLNAMIVPALLSLSAFLVIISGGIDVSFPAIASLSMYIATVTVLETASPGNFAGIALFAVIIGAALGSINGILVILLKLPTLIITLGTSSMFIGFMLGTLRAREIADIPMVMHGFGGSALFIVRDPIRGLTSPMSPSFLILIGVFFLCFCMFRFTMLGRSVYAVGGDETAAKRSGFSIVKTKMFVYMLSGGIAGLAGIIRVCMLQNCYPTNLLGTELDAIAAVVLGGASITSGGIGTLIGTFLGTALLTIMRNSMILLGIPTYWQSFFTGLLILIGIGVSAYQSMQSGKRIRKKIHTQ